LRLLGIYRRSIECWFFRPNSTDGTSAASVFAKAPPTGQVNLSPFAGLQFFGEVNIDKKKPALTET